MRKVLSKVENPPYRETIEANVISHLIANAQRMDFYQLQLEAVWCLTNIASDDTENSNSVEVLVNAQILPTLKILLNTP